MSDTGTIALVTGASRGIGRAIATELGKQGLIVVGTATTEQGAASISEYLQTAGVTGKGYCADVSSQESVSSLLSSIEEEFCITEL